MCDIMVTVARANSLLVRSRVVVHTYAVVVAGGALLVVTTERGVTTSPCQVYSQVVKNMMPMAAWHQPNLLADKNKITVTFLVCHVIQEIDHGSQGGCCNALRSLTMASPEVVIVYPGQCV
jgi:hypothetical protein